MLSRKLATYYGGWRQKLLDNIVLHAIRDNHLLIVDKKEAAMAKLLTPTEKGGLTQFRAELGKICEKYGLEPTENEHYIVLKAKQ